MFSKDAIVSKVLKTFANHFISAYGTLETFQVNSQDKSINLTVMLQGELNELNLQLFDYEINFEHEKAYLVFSSMHASRQWINLLYQNILSQKELKIEIPANLAKPLKMFI
ncbi:MAG: hypothetical protein R6U84_10065 [Candidatus Cloacimonadales bacterium]